MNAGRRVWLALLLGVISWLAQGQASAATEIVLVLDNSCSMVNESEYAGETIPPADPDRLSVLATLILTELRDPNDSLHILNFNGNGKEEPQWRALPVDKESIRGIDYDSMTLFRGVTTEANRILSSSQHERRLLVFLTDGMPSERLTPGELRGILGERPPFDVLAIGVNRSRQILEAQEAYLGELTRGVGTYFQVTDPAELVTRFTKAYAAQLGSKPFPDPEAGPGAALLKPGAARDVRVGKYVRELLVVATTTDRSGPFGASLLRGVEAVAPSDEGDSGCVIPPGVRYVGSLARSCEPPHDHYKVWKVPNDPGKASNWRLAVDSGAVSPVAFGFILRYELGAEIMAAPARARVGETIPIEARINYRGQTFDDGEFFEADGFEAWAVLGEQKVPLKRGDDSRFRGALRADELGIRDLRVLFSNRWMELEASSSVAVEGYLPLSLEVKPIPLDLGDWQGSHERIERCADVSLDGSTNAGRVPLELAVRGLPEGFGVTVAAPERVEIASDGLLALPEGRTEFQFCLSSPACCEELDERGLQVQIRGRDPHYHSSAASLPLRFHVEQAGWLRCWMPVLVMMALALLISLLIYGFIRPHSFEDMARIRLSGSERGLARAPARPLRELPGGRRGFYRSATVAFDAGGGPRAPRKSAMLRLRAGYAGEVLCMQGRGLERKNPRTRRWEVVSSEEAERGLRRRVVFRVGELFFRIE